MYYFNSDYTEGCHPAVLKKLVETNTVQTTGYGLDQYCDEARKLIKDACDNQNIDIHFLVGGTQTNLTVICAALRPHQAVYGAVPSHINTHEAGAIEHVGHRVLPLPSADGKLTAAQIDEAWKKYDNDPSREHWAQPKMVYISQPTEIGSMYTKKELSDLYAVCKKAGIYLFIDGARLSYALGSPENDLTLKDITDNCDVFTIGGTKCGLLFGEAVVIVNDTLKPDFRTIAKQNGAILAKGRLLGIQFAEIFRNNLYLKTGSYGTKMALKIKEAVTKKGIKFITDSPTNQQFIILTPSQYQKLSQDFNLSLIEYLNDGNYSVRICTSWATEEKQVNELIKAIENL